MNLDQFSKKTLIALSIAIGTSVFVLGWRFYKQSLPANLCRITSKEVAECLTKCPISFKNSQKMPLEFSELLSLPSPTFDLYCSNLLYSKFTTSTQRILDTYFGGIQDSLIYIADVQTNGIGRTGP